MKIKPNKDELALLKARARSLRNSATLAERRLWVQLKDRGVAGYKFRRQHVLYPYIADFYCPAARLVVEVDGAGHGGPRDRTRDEYLTEHFNVSVLRFTNDEVRDDLERVVRAIETWLEG